MRLLVAPFLLSLLLLACSNSEVGRADESNVKTAFDLTSAIASHMSDVSLQEAYNCLELSEYIGKMDISETQSEVFKSLYDGSWKAILDNSTEADMSVYGGVFERLNKKAKMKLFPECMKKISSALPNVDFKDSSFRQEIN